MDRREYEKRERDLLRAHREKIREFIIDLQHELGIWERELGKPGSTRAPSRRKVAEVVVDLDDMLKERMDEFYAGPVAQLKEQLRVLDEEQRTT